MTVLSLKLSRILDVNTQNALEIFVVVGWGVGGGQGGQKFLLLQKAGICWFTLFGYCHLWELSATTIRL